MNSHYMAYFFSNKRILGISTKSGVDHVIAQTREREFTREILPSVIDDLCMIDVYAHIMKALRISKKGT